MKHRIFLTICLALLSFVARAQQGLSVNALFTGKVVPREEMVEVRVKGRAISKYGLQFYHSVRFKDNEQQRKTVDELVERDRKMATDIKQTNRKGATTLIIPQTAWSLSLSVLSHIDERPFNDGYCGLYGGKCGKHCRIRKISKLNYSL